MKIKEVFEKNGIDLDSIFDSIQEGVVISNTTKNFLFWNRAAKLMLEDEPDETDPGKWAERYRLFDPESREHLPFSELPMIRALSGDEFYDYLVMTKNKSNPSGMVLSVNGKPLKNGDETIGGITTFRDVSELLRKQCEVRNERNFYERVLDLIPGIVFIKGLDGKFIYGNKNFQDLLGDSSVIGKSSDHYLAKEMAEKVYAHDRLVLASGKPIEFEEIIHWNDGTRSTFKTTRFPYIGENGEVRGICAVAKDITNEIQINADLQQERNRAAQASKLAAIGVLSAEIAHEIKNPLTILQMASDVLNFAVDEKEIDRSLIKEKIKVVNETIARMNKVVSSLGILSRDGAVEKDSLTTVRRILENIMALCSFKTRSLNMEIELLDSQELDLNISCNQVQISEVLLNLTMNALEAVEGLRDPRIKISVEENNESLTFKIWDNGPGVPKEIREKIFEPFFTTKGHLNGTGLGLSISKKIVGKHSGNLYYQELEASHCFVMEIPLR